MEQPGRPRTAEARLVQRALIPPGLRGGGTPTAAARRPGVSRPTAYARAARFNESGLDGLRDRPRPGRPPTCTAGQRAAVVAAALTRPEDLRRGWPGAGGPGQAGGRLRPAG